MKSKSSPSKYYELSAVLSITILTTWSVGSISTDTVPRTKIPFSPVGGFDGSTNLFYLLALGNWWNQTHRCKICPHLFLLHVAMEIWNVLLNCKNVCLDIIRTWSRSLAPFQALTFHSSHVQALWSSLILIRRVLNNSPCWSLVARTSHCFSIAPMMKAICVIVRGC